MPAPREIQGEFPFVCTRIQPHVTSVARVDAPFGCTSVFSAAARLCCGEPFPCTLCWGPPALTGTKGLCLPLGQQGTRCWMTWHYRCLPGNLLTHLPPHTGQGAMTVQFSPEQHLQAGKQLRAQPRTRENSPDAIQPLLPQCHHRHPAQSLLTSCPPRWRGQLQGRVCSSLSISMQIQFTGSKNKDTDERFCSPSLLQSNPTRHPCSLHPLLQTLKPKAGKSCTEKAVSSGGRPALLGTKKGSQGGGEQQILTRLGA